jgi:CheY-like chemotaxis protein
MRILIIEDDPTSLKLTSEVLQSGGHVVMLATSADQAIVSIRAVTPDCILVDLRLPGIRGLSVVRQCREEASTESIPIIAITGYPDKYSKGDAINAGCDAYITKPVNTRTLLPEIEAVVLARTYQTLNRSCP